MSKIDPTRPERAEPVCPEPRDGRIVPVIMCGGVGTRLWPMSRAQSPKQFHPTDGKGSLTYFQATVQRHASGLYAPPVVVTSVHHLPTVRRQLAELQCKARIIAEPVARNTGPAVLAAALSVVDEDPDAPLLILPSDHVIGGDFDAAARGAMGPASDGSIVMFGIKPDYAETGYGYIVDGGAFVTHPGLRRVAKFVEKPPLAEASALIASGAAFWASGISMFTASTIVEEFRRLDARTLRAVTLALGRAERPRDEIHLNADAFRGAANEPTERIVFEVSDRVTLAPTNVAWSDVGSWTSIHMAGDADDNGNVFRGDVISTGTENALVRSEDRLVALVGVPEVIVIDTPDALLVTRRGQCQDVKEVVELLKAEQRPESLRHRTREHEWGSSVNVMRAEGYDMSVLRIRPGTALQLDPAPGRKLIPMSGALDVFDGMVRRTLTVGEHLALVTPEASRVSNPGDRTAEVLLLTMTSQLSDSPATDVLNYAT